MRLERATVAAMCSMEFPQPSRRQRGGGEEGGLGFSLPFILAAGGNLGRVEKEIRKFFKYRSASLRGPRPDS